MINFQTVRRARLLGVMQKQAQEKTAFRLSSLLGRAGRALNPVPHFRDAHLARSLVRGGGLPVDVAGKLQSQQRKALLRGLKATGLATGAAAVPVGAAAGARALTQPADKAPTEKTAFRLSSLLGRAGRAMDPRLDFSKYKKLQELLRTGRNWGIQLSPEVRIARNKHLLHGLGRTGLATGAVAAPVVGAAAGARALTQPADKAPTEKKAFYACLGDRYIVLQGEHRGRIGVCEKNNQSSKTEEYVDEDGAKVTKRKEDSSLTIKFSDGQTFSTDKPEGQVRSYYGDKHDRDDDQVKSSDSDTCEAVKGAAVMDPQQSKLGTLLRRVINGDEGLEQIIEHLKSAKEKKQVAG